MRVNVISDTIQEFNGERFYLCGEYFQHDGKRLHRAVWEYHFGPVPDGCDIHHIDGDKHHNDKENLGCIPRTEHHSIHTSTPAFLAYAKRHIEEIRPAASEWHGSDAGRAWHSAQGKANWEKRVENEYTCTECGATYKTKHVYKPGSNRFCSGKCKARYGRRARRSRDEG